MDIITDTPTALKMVGYPKKLAKEREREREKSEDYSKGRQASERQSGHGASVYPVFLARRPVF